MTITDHAIVRYLERFCELDTKSIKKSISEYMKKYGGVDGYFPFHEATDLTAIVKEGTLVTFIKTSEIPSHINKKLKKSKKIRRRLDSRNKKILVHKFEAHTQDKKEESLSDILYSGNLPKDWLDE